MTSYVPIEDFPSVPGESWDEKKARHREAMKGKIGRPFLKRSSRALRGADGHGNDYREDLAAHPNDPDAWVSGPRSLQRLIDKRKRQGWLVGERSLQDVANAKAGADPMSSKEMVETAYKRAEAKGFVPDAQKEN